MSRILLSADASNSSRSSEISTACILAILTISSSRVFEADSSISAVSLARFSSCSFFNCSMSTASGDSTDGGTFVDDSLGPPSVDLSTGVGRPPMPIAFIFRRRSCSRAFEEVLVGIAGLPTNPFVFGSTCLPIPTPLALMLWSLSCSLSRSPDWKGLCRGGGPRPSGGRSCTVSSSASSGGTYEMNLGCLGDSLPIIWSSRMSFATNEESSTTMPPFPGNSTARLFRCFRCCPWFGFASLCLLVASAALLSLFSSSLTRAASSTLLPSFRFIPLIISFKSVESRGLSWITPLSEEARRFSSNCCLVLM
mmetsp:Transcript_22368/g.50762  ORF Transcript_22368/g.50762 Transcript_22368/m.50762 type:complete len:309 (-) Transcript_22368:239-1165(-)